MITVPVTFDAANRKKDKSVSLRFTTNLEISNQDFATMDRFVSQAGWLGFSENEDDMADIPKENAPTEGKSLSERLRSVLYVRWNTLTDKQTPFDQYRSIQMEKIIERLKQDLPRREG